MNSNPVPKVLFVDLDGTVVLDNSFHLFLWSIWVHGGTKLRMVLLRAALARLIRVSDGRMRMKRSVLHGFAQAGAGRQSAVVRHTLAKMSRTVSQPVLARTAAYRDDGWLVVLATAAPECYARPFAEILGFDDCLATPPVTDPEEWVELIGMRKAQACRAWAEALAGSNSAEVAAISDHREDLPLLQMASRVVIQAPPDDAEWLMSGLPDGTLIDQIDPVNGDENGGMWLWINDRPSGPHDSWEVRTILSKHRYALLYRDNARWSRVLPGHSLERAALRAECPRPPAVRDRMSVAARRIVIRDILGIFH